MVPVSFPHTAGNARDAGADSFSPIDNELPLRWTRRFRLAPPDGFGAGRRALGFALLTWLPIAVWEFVRRGGFGANSDESLLHHYSIHVRCLLVIPLLILAEPMLHRAVKELAARLAAVAVVTPEARARFDAVARDVARIRDATLPWILIAGLVIAWTIVDQPDAHVDAIAWAVDASGALGFGGWWFAFVARPILLALLLAWLWRILLVAYWSWQLARIDLSLVPTHPDRTGGIAFVEKLPGAFALVSVALSAMLASRWAHEILHHGASFAGYQPTIVLFVALWTLLLLLPQLALAPLLGRVRGAALPAYSQLVGTQGRLVHRRWIERAEVADDPILSAPEIGPVADSAAMYDAVARMRRFPIGKASIVKIVLPLALPILVVAALQIPLKELLKKLLALLM